MGLSPSSIGFDFGVGEIFVGNEGGQSVGIANVSVISDATDRPIASIPTSQTPTAFAYDFDRSEMFIPTSDYGVDVVYDSNDTRRADIQLGQHPEMGATYDPAKAEVFVTDGQQVSVISADSNTVVATVDLALPGGLPSGPLGIVYDRLKGEVFVADSLASTVSVINDTSDAVVATIPVGTFPQAVAFEGTLGEVFVANNASNNVSVISDSTNKVVATIPVGSDPSGVTWDGQTEEMFVSNWGSDNVSVVSDSSNTVSASVPVGSGPSAITFDGTRSAVFVANSGSDTVSVLSSGTQRVTNSVSVPPLPWGFAVDPSIGEVFATNVGDYPDNLTVISEATDRVSATVPVGDSPKGAAYDAGKGEVFVANSADGSVSVVSVADDSVVATIPVGTVPYGVSYDPAVGEVFVSNEYSFTVSVINDTTDRVVATVPVGMNPEGITVDPGAGEVFVVNDESSNVTVLSVTTDRSVGQVQVGTNPVDAVFDPDASEVFVTNSGGDNVTAFSATTLEKIASYPVGSSPAGLAYNSQTSEVYVANSDSNNVSVISTAVGKAVQALPVGSSPQGVVCDPTSGEVFVANTLSNNVSVIGVSVALGSVTFRETGLPWGTPWSVGIVGGKTYRSSTNVLTFEVAPGTSEYTIGRVSGLWPSPAGGEFTSNGAAVTIAVAFALPTFEVLFAEGVLPSGTLWWVNVSAHPSLSSTSSPISTALPNGSYSYTVAAVVPPYTETGHGTFAVSGETVEVLPAFARVERFSVTFDISGLPLHTEWWLNVSGRPAMSSLGTSISLTLPNGTYTVTVVSSDLRYQVVGSRSGSFVVDGLAVTRSILFGFEPSGVCFAETGLSYGTEWSVALGGVSQTSSTASMIFYEPDGTYDYTVQPVPGYAANPSSGAETVAGTNLTIQIGYEFTSNLSLSFSVNPGTTGAPEPAPEAVAFSASATGGTPPYEYTWDLGGGVTRSTPEFDYTFEATGNYLATVTVTDSAGVSTSGEQIVRIGTSGYVSGWVPAWDAYNFGNPGSVWSAGGNCYGMSSTAVLYYDRSVLGNADAPNLPDDASYFPNPLPYLSPAEGPPRNLNGQWDSFDNITLAIYLHQTSPLNRLPSSFDNAAAATAVLAALADSKQPVVIGLGPNDPHAVVIYAAQTFSNESVEFAISDPNTFDASLTTDAWFVPPDTFRYHYIYTWSNFGVVPDAPFWQGSGLLGQPSAWAVKTLTGGWQLIEANEAVTVSSHGVDSFADADAGNSQTFVQGIAGSAGIEEGSTSSGSWQAYLVPPGDPNALVDPGTSTTLRIIYGANDSGIPSLEAVQVEVAASAPGQFTLQRTNEGFSLNTSSSPVTLNVTAAGETGSGWDLLNVSDLPVGADQFASLAVSNWATLNSTTRVSANLTIGNESGAGSPHTHGLRNGQRGLGSAGGPTPSRPFPGWSDAEEYGVVGAVGVGILIAAVVIGRRGRRKEPPAPGKNPSVRPVR